MSEVVNSKVQKLSFEEFQKSVLEDYKTGWISREMSLLGRKEVLSGKAKFGIFGDGKEVAQIALAKSFKKGDWRSGYYRDQTWMLALGELTPEQFFAQLYANPDQTQDPFSSGRQMNSHFATPFTDSNGEWINLTTRYNSTADASPTAGQMPRSLGVALASKVYRNNPELNNGFKHFSQDGNEISFVSIGDASTSEGLFWETVNAAGVLQVPLAISVWDDGYGISVSKKYQTTKESISEVLSGFATNEKGEGIDIYICEGWNYAKLIQLYKEGTEAMRKSHRPALFHIIEVTQPQGHSTSGSHERYKSKERLDWEREYDCLKQMRLWMISNGLATEEDAERIEAEAKEAVVNAKRNAWSRFSSVIKEEISEVTDLIEKAGNESGETEFANSVIATLTSTIDPVRKDILKAAKKVLIHLRGEGFHALNELRDFARRFQEKYQHTYSSHHHSETRYNALKVPEVKAVYQADSKMLNGYEILNTAFDSIFSRYPNQGFAGLQDKFGLHRIFDTGIREATIMGQAIGLSLRGLRPIAEIQYLDYLLYGLEPLSDDVACLRYRTGGIQKAPLIIRTRGHRLEGIWHTGSPMSMILGSLRGIYVCVPRNMVQAAGMYNTLLQSDEPALVIECLNGYRLKEQLPDNLDTFTVPLGVPEVVHYGNDVTLVTYGSCVRIAEEAMKLLSAVGISVELIDVRTLLPFDIHHSIIESIKKTNRVVFLDEDVPGGGSAYMFQQVFEVPEILFPCGQI
jgi:pyruvate/2-oxoglutarate/acetoin dehydrogenase E1 component/TPP-dependent pyruvate/acetoin dehydrogenase alpha subunit